MEELVALGKSFLQYGIGGALALIWFKLWLDGKKENTALRDRLEAQEKANGARFETQGKEHARELAAAAEKFAMLAKGIEDAHREQEDELTDRLLKSVETHAENNGRMAEKVSMLVDSMRRGGERGPTT